MFGDKEKLKNPAKAFFEFKSEKQKFTAYNKKTEKEFDLPLPAHFVLLDDLHAAKGYVKVERKFASSNEVRDMRSQKLTIKTYGGNLKIDGYWPDIKKEANGFGIKHTNSLYCLYKNGDSYSIINIQLKGGAGTEWIHNAYGNTDPITKEKTPPKFDVKKHVIVIKDEFLVKESGIGDYNVPVFDFVDMNDEFRDEATKAVNEELRPYLAEYFKEDES